MMGRGPAAASGHTSTQYFVQATIRSSFPMAARITVALGWRLTTRRGVWSAGIANLMVQGFGPKGLRLPVAFPNLTTKDTAEYEGNRKMCPSV